MAKKQKAKKQTNDLINTQNNSLAYQGKVKVQVAHGNQIISTKTYHNKGLPDLFKYLSHALAGAYYPTLRPCKVALFNYANSDSTQGPEKFDWATATTSNIFTSVSPYVVYDASPVVTVTAEGYATTYRFKIPFNWLYRNTFNVIGLFSENNSECAYYLCVKEEDGKIVWDGEPLSDINGNYSLIIEWTMELSNK